MSGSRYENRPEWRPSDDEPFDAERHILAKDVALQAVEAVESGFMKMFELAKEWGMVRTTMQRQMEWHLGREMVIGFNGLRGSLNGNAKLTDEQVELIQSAPRYFTASVIRLHYDLDISITQIKRVRNGSRSGGLDD